MMRRDPIERVIERYRNEIDIIPLERFVTDAQGRRWAEVSYNGESCYLPATKDYSLGQRLLFGPGMNVVPLVEKLFYKGTPNVIVSLEAPAVLEIPTTEIHVTMLEPRVVIPYAINGLICAFRGVKYGRFYGLYFGGDYLEAFGLIGASFSAVSISAGEKYVCVRTNKGVSVFEIVYDSEYGPYLQKVSFNALHRLLFAEPDIPHIDIENSQSFMVVAKYDTFTENMVEMKIFRSDGSSVAETIATMTLIRGPVAGIVSVSGPAKQVWIGETLISDTRLLAYVPDEDTLALQAFFDATGARFFVPKVNKIGVFNTQGEQEAEILFDIPDVIQGDTMAKIPGVFVLEQEYLIGSLTENLGHLYAFFCDRALNVSNYTEIKCYDYLGTYSAWPAHTLLQVRPWQRFCFLPK